MSSRLRGSPDRPLVTVVTPSFAQGRFIRQTIESVLQQEYEPIEYIVVDGGSTDGTLDLLRGFEGRLTLVSEPDQGQADAVNKGWRLARGQLLAWINSDDVYTPGAVASAVRALEAYPEASVVHSDCIEIAEDGRPLRRLRGSAVTLEGLLLLEARAYQPTVFVRRNVLDRIGLLNPECHLALDHEFYLRAASAGCVFHYVPELWAAARIHPQAKTQRLAHDILAEQLRIIDGVGARPEGARIRCLLAEARARVYLEEGGRALDRGLRVRARECLLESLKLRRWRPRSPSFRAALLLLDAMLGTRAGRRAVAALRRLAVRLGATEAWETPWREAMRPAAGEGWAASCPAHAGVASDAAGSVPAGCSCSRR